MSLAVLYSRALSGMEAALVTVEVHLANGLPSFTIVGLPETEVKESKDRVRAALQNCQFDFPARRITVNLAPADLPKESGRFDLPIALGILAATGQIPADKLAEYEYAGELALTGELRPIRGALAMTYRAVNSGRAFILPHANAAEAALVNDATVYAAQSLLQVAAHLSGREMMQPFVSQPKTTPPYYPDMREVKGQAQAKRALEIAAAGGGWTSRHRQNSLLTYRALVEAAGEGGTEDIVLAHAASCIFSPQETGFSNTKNDSPGSKSVLELMNKTSKSGE